MATSNRAPKPRSGTLRSNERAAIYQRRQEEHALGSFNVQMDAACDASAMADSLRNSLAELSIDSPLRNHANFATISAKAWEGSPGSQDTALATMFFDAQGPRPTYANFATSVPEQNPFTRAAAQDAENCSASTHGRGTSQSNISQYNSGCRGSQINYHYHAAAPPTHRVSLRRGVRAQHERRDCCSPGRPHGAASSREAGAGGVFPREGGKERSEEAAQEGAALGEDCTWSCCRRCCYAI